MSGRGNILPRKNFPDVHLLPVSPEIILYMTVGCGRDQLSMLAREALNTYRRLTSPGEDYRWVTPTSGNGAFTISCQPIVRRCHS